MYLPAPTATYDDTDGTVSFTVHVASSVSIYIYIVIYVGTNSSEIFIVHEVIYVNADGTIILQSLLQQIIIKDNINK